MMNFYDNIYFSISDIILVNFMKSYLWSTISQESLNRLALIAIESVLMEDVDIENFIDELFQDM